MSSYIEYKTDHPLADYCRNASNSDGDKFVGFKLRHIDDCHYLSISFPIGYNISEDDETVRDEIIQLLSILQYYNDQQSMISKLFPEQTLTTLKLPIQAYYIVLIDFLNNGYFQVKDERYQRNTSGPINWRHTILREEPIVLPEGFLYSQYRVKHFLESNRDLITEINKFCVYQSYLYLGWIYKLNLPPKPVRKHDSTEYKKYLVSAFMKVNRDKEKYLFQAMLDILNYENNVGDPDEIYYGTNNFEYIWEKLIQETYGNTNKEDYFPRTRWLLNIGEEKQNTALEPDTVMRNKDDIYILDAKYYKYGITNNPRDLPNSSSINKQITYGEYVATDEKFKREREAGMQVYNAFLLPHDSTRSTYSEVEGAYYSIGEAKADWKNSDESYERVQGILVDIKLLMSNTIKPNKIEIEKLSKEIFASLKKNKF